MEQPFDSEDLAKRRTASRRLGWLIAAIALLLYVAGLFIKR
ncbi:hypothetical protein [Dechloromonas sp. H13]|nr:hypothetical protein [Dechloromonas sp. H13]